MFTSKPSLSSVELEEVLSSFGISDVETSDLPSERDLNLRVTAKDGRQFVLKLSKHDSLPALEAQNAVLVSCARLGSVCPQVVKNVRGESVSSGPRQLLVRMLTYEPGAPIALLPGLRSDPTFLSQLGELAGRMDAEFEQSFALAPPPALLIANFQWDMCNYKSVVQKNRHALEDDPEFLSLVDRVFAIADAEIDPVLAALPRSVIHGDLNTWNILHSEEGGIKFIDFGLRDLYVFVLVFFKRRDAKGDVINSITVGDLAILIAYCMLETSLGLGMVLESLVRGYEMGRALSAAEKRAVPALAALRLCVSAAVGAAQLRAAPDNAHLALYARAVKAALPPVLDLLAQRAVLRPATLAHETFYVGSIFFFFFVLAKVSFYKTKQRWSA